MADSTGELDAAGLMQCIGQPFNKQTLFKPGMFGPASAGDIEEYLPFEINYSLTVPEKYRLLGITVEQLHVCVNDSGIVMAIFVQLDNRNLVDRLRKVAGDIYTASGTSFEENAPPSFYSWDYKGGEIDLFLNAYKLQLEPVVGRDFGRLVFHDGNPLNFIKMSKERKEAELAELKSVHEYDPAALLSCIGKSLKDQNVINPFALIQPSAEDGASCAPYKINTTLKTLRELRILGIPVKKLHLMLDDDGIIEMIVLQAGSVQFASKLTELTGQKHNNDKGEKMWWRYNGGCITIYPRVNKPALEGGTAQAGLLIFSKCDH